MKISIFTGCVIPIKYPGMEAAARRIAPMLGIELVDVKFGCCPSPVGLKSVHFDAWLALAARNLCLTEEKGLDVVTICSGCTNTLKETDHILALDEKKRLFVHDMLRRSGRTFRGGMKIYHLPELLAGEEVLERMESRLVRPLRGLRIGTHYGCHYHRPAEVMAAGASRADAMGGAAATPGTRGDPGARASGGVIENTPTRNAKQTAVQPAASPPSIAPPVTSPLPQDMEIILETLGAEVAEYNRQDLCCGAALSINTGASAQSLAIADEKLGWMREANLDALAVSCPACFTQFDTGQLLLSRRAAAGGGAGFSSAREGHAPPDAPGGRAPGDGQGELKTNAVEGKRAIPVFHIAELVAYALGMKPAEMDLGSHKIKATWAGL
jgi:heterodisulfide reductase subunit B